MKEEVTEDNREELIQPQLEAIQARVLGVLMEKATNHTRCLSTDPK
jgi:uncharacterized protein YceH (UPF0502 family)